MDVRDIFGEEYAFRAGTVGTVAAELAYGVCQGSMRRDFGKSTIEDAEVRQQLSMQLGSNGRPVSIQGIVVIPNYMDVL